MTNKTIIALLFNPPLEGGSKNPSDAHILKHGGRQALREDFFGEGYAVNAVAAPLPEAVFTLARESTFDPPSRGG
jgi:hypothetical protein